MGVMELDLRRPGRGRLERSKIFPAQKRGVVCFFVGEFRRVKQKTCFTSFEKSFFFIFLRKSRTFCFFSGPTWNVHYLKQGISKNLVPWKQLLKNQSCLLHPQAMAIPWQKPWELWAMPRAKKLGSFHLKPRLRPLRPVHVVVYLGKKGMERFEDVDMWWLFPKIGVYTPQIIHFNRGFRYFHHAFWGTPIFGNTQMMFDIDIHGSFENHFFLGGIFLKCRFLESKCFFWGEFLHLCHPNCIFNEPTNSCDEGVIHSRVSSTAVGSFICVRSGAGTTNQSIVTSTGRCHMWAYGWGGSRWKEQLVFGSIGKGVRNTECWLCDCVTDVNPKWCRIHRLLGK